MFKIRIFIFMVSIVSLSAEIDFKKEIKPILDSYCIKCHGAKKQKSSLRLDEPSFFRKGGKHGLVILGGKPNESEFLKRIKLPIDNDDAMPGKNKKLKDFEISLIERWVKEGADMGDGKKTVTHDKSKTPNFVMDSFAEKVNPPDKEAVNQLKKSGAIIKAVSTNYNFISVSFKFSRNEIDTASIEKLKKNIIWLDIASSQLDIDVLNTIGSLTNLRRLSMQNSVFSEKDLQVLGSLQNLEYLNLYETNISDTSVKLLRSLKSLQKLYIAKTRISKKGIVMLTENQPRLKVIPSL
jgi:hypothetical protein